jgi:hypothetical protein
VTPHAVARWAKAERFLEQTNLADELRRVADYDDRKIPNADEAAELRAKAIDFVAYCRSLL